MKAYTKGDLRSVRRIARKERQDIFTNGRVDGLNNARSIIRQKINQIISDSLVEVCTLDKAVYAIKKLREISNEIRKETNNS